MRTIALAFLLVVAAVSLAPPRAGGPVDNRRAIDAYAALPLSFEANRGQTAAAVQFLSRGPRHTLFLTATEAVLAMTRPQPAPRGPAGDEDQPRAGAVLRMAFVGADPAARGTGREELPAKANYYIGNDPARWHTGARTFASVQYQDIYPGVDLVYYGNGRNLEYDFVVAPGADAARIALAFEGADRLQLEQDGDLAILIGGDTLRMQKPTVYQEVDGVRTEVAGSYVLTDGNRVGFQLAAYDARRPLIIDPVLFYSTYLGGSGADHAYAVAVDLAGNAYVTGSTGSADFPTTAGTFQTASGSHDAFVAKLDPTGTALMYSTYLGGSSFDYGFGIAVDIAGDAYVTGGTPSANFPTTPGAFHTTAGGNGDAFVAKVGSTGGLIYSTCLGGTGTDGGRDIAVDASGSAHVTGFSVSISLATSGAFQSTMKGSSDAFVAKVSAAGSGLTYWTYLGGTGGEFGEGLALDAGGNAYVTGRTSSTNFPTTVGAFQPASGGGDDGFLTKVNPTGSALLHSSYLGGTDFESSFGVALDLDGSAYVTGETYSPNFPTTAGALQPAYGGNQDAFVTKVDPTGATLAYFTYLGGSSFDSALGIAVDASGHAHVTGYTGSADFPTTSGSFQEIYGGGGDAFVTKVNPSGSGLGYSTYLGGAYSEGANGIAVDALPSPNAYVEGSANPDFPTTAGVFQTEPAGDGDAFVSKIADLPAPPSITAGKTTGGGTIRTASGSLASFGFIVESESASGPVHGNLQYVDRVSGVRVSSVSFTSLAVSGNTAAFKGTCTSNGAPCTFTVSVTDEGEPGTSDAFTISVPGVSNERGVVRGGNIQIH